MQRIELTARPRVRKSTTANGRDRRSGLLPAIIYGGNEPPMPITLDRAHFLKISRSIHSSSIVSLEIEGHQEKQQALIREIQRDPVSDIKILHVDFYRIEAGKLIEVDIPVHAIGGTPAGVKLGGILETLIRRIHVRCLPKDVPEYFEIDISGLEIGDSLHISDLQVPEGIEVRTDAAQPLFSVVAPKAEEEKPAVAVGAEGAVEGAEAAPAAAEGSDDKKEKK